MSIRDKISALETEIAAADARIANTMLKWPLQIREHPKIAPVPPKQMQRYKSCFRVQTFQKTRNSKFYRNCELLEVMFEMA